MRVSSCLTPLVLASTVFSYHKIQKRDALSIVASAEVLGNSVALTLCVVVRSSFLAAALIGGKPVQSFPACAALDILIQGSTSTVTAYITQTPSASPGSTIIQTQNVTATTTQSGPTSTTTTTQMGPTSTITTTSTQPGAVSTTTTTKTNTVTPLAAITGYIGMTVADQLKTWYLPTAFPRESSPYPTATSLAAAVTLPAVAGGACTALPSAPFGIPGSFSGNQYMGIDSSAVNDQILNVADETLMWNVDCSQNTQTGAPLLYTYTVDANLNSNNFYCAYGPNGGNGDVTIFQLGADECPGQQVFPFFIPIDSQAAAFNA